MRRKLDQATVKELLDFDPDRGTFVWKWRARCWFKSDRSFSSFNSRWPDRPALNCLDGSGHLQGKILGRLYSAHRVAWLWVHGRCPAVVDHINRQPRDNRICNLRAATVLSNARNKSLSENNATGHVGNYENDFSYCVMLAGRYLGSFDTYEQAAAVRQAAQCAAGFSDSHGAPRA
jgi:HNH endonuclease